MTERPEPVQQKLMAEQHALADKLLQVGALQFENQPNPRLALSLRPTTHPTHPGPVTPEIMEMIKEEYRLLMSGRYSRFDRLAPIGGPETPFADILTGFTDRPNLRLKLGLHHPPQDGFDGRVIGDYRGTDETYAGDRVLLVDEHMNGRMRSAVHILRGKGLRIYAAMMFIDRDSLETRGLRRDNVNVLSVMTSSALLDYYRTSGQVPSK